MGQAKLLRHLLSLDRKERFAQIQSLSEHERREIRYHWKLWAREEQLAPDHDWSLWLICAGRGFGKTRAGAEWVRNMAKRHPAARIALVASSLAEARAVMIEGESGLLELTPPERTPVFEPSLRRLTWPNGAQAFLYSSAEPEGMRGPQHSHAWCDEIAKWDNSSDRATRTWDNLLMGLRLGEKPQIVATTTPRAVPLMRRLLDEEKCGRTIITRGSTYDNSANLPERFLLEMEQSFGASSIGRQELDGEMLLDAEGALWTRAMLEDCSQEVSPAKIVRVVVGVDPPASARGDACGIIVAGLDETGIARVLADCSVEKPTPEQWARAAARAAQLWSADRVIAEANQGGSMVASVLRAADISLPVKLVHASRGKTARAEPVAALYEAGRVRHAGLFAQLEDELCGLMAGGKYEGSQSGGSRSPDRADALVWALTELMLGKSGQPRVHQV